MKNLSDILGGAAVPKAKMSEQEIAAKLEVVKQLMDEMMSSMGHGVKSHLDGLKQVTVAAPSDELLAKGLDVAKQVVPKIEDAEPEDASEEKDELETPAMDAAEAKDPSIEANEPEKDITKAGAESADAEEEPMDLYSMMQRKKKLGMSKF